MLHPQYFTYMFSAFLRDNPSGLCMSFTRHDPPALAARQMWFPTILPPLDNHYFNVINRRIFGFPSHKNVISMPGFPARPAVAAAYEIARCSGMLPDGLLESRPAFRLVPRMESGRE
ncbi:MAG: hypothetical protein BGO99_03640 [Nitrosospira sp. 56-18]|jgi:hypothetical protein|nr:hypothetical protein [Nitrosospira sp.]OJY09352.1 MAG: hypothetical protein BGO99_03640 [Nitrosospira sp. 56-18]